ncbi:MAG: hypothetical protein QG608_386 [Actinomycetota bacterium]|nr:hypothetical protein [Actinomycetota bacterium]
MGSEKYRLVTRSDFDGLMCAVLLRSLDLIEGITFVHPKDVQDGKVEITNQDILTNLPHSPYAKLVFDHHHSETLRTSSNAMNHVIIPNAPSAARVVYEYYGGKLTFDQIPTEAMEAVDQADSANYQLEDILRPRRWALLNFVMDSRTGLGRFRHFRISNYQLMMQLIDEVLRHEGVDQILQDPDVVERIELYQEQQELFVEQLRRITTVHGDIVVVDLRGEEVIYAGNRFMVYALYPECRVSAHVIWGKQKQNTVIAVGKSILDRTSPVDIGALMLRYGGGGHKNAGTCQIAHEDSEKVLAKIIDTVNEEAEMSRAAPTTHAKGPHTFPRW